MHPNYSSCKMITLYFWPLITLLNKPIHVFLKNYIFFGNALVADGCRRCSRCLERDCTEFISLFREFFFFFGVKGLVEL